MPFLHSVGNLFKAILFNKYLLVLIVFGILITFFDKYSLIRRFKTGQNIKSLEKELRHYQNEIEVNKAKIEELQSSDENLEKFARETYLMKKENEEVFIVK
ncbi:MAG: septum formation initiator family protein [Prevotellaceae bacterium]|jgi:cell division protein FtsB|nr:septum formation initiator family protein [Prevotellaceae bacterium]